MEEFRKLKKLADIVRMASGGKATRARKPIMLNPVTSEEALTQLEGH
jgi:hypothetical protein